MVPIWEKTILGSDMMTFSTGWMAADNSFSSLDLAVLKDTGWWTDVNEDFADNIIWGKGEGCAFLTGDCDDLFAEVLFINLKKKSHYLNINYFYFLRLN